MLSLLVIILFALCSCYVNAAILEVVHFALNIYLLETSANWDVKFDGNVCNPCGSVS